MKTSHTALLGAAFCAALFAFTRTPMAQEVHGEPAHGDAGAADPGQWYLVEQDNGPDLAGRSPFDPANLMETMKRDGFLHLDDCRTQQIGGAWTATGGERLTGTVYVRASLVRSFKPLKSDPLTWKAAEGKKE